MNHTYAIDLGIHPDATGGKSGTHKDDSYPLQIALTQGTLAQDPLTGQMIFQPEALASFAQIKLGDILIFRAFDIAKISGGSRQLLDVSSLKISFTKLDGSESSKPWPGDEDRPFSRFETEQLSKAFTSKLGGMKLPCYYQRDGSNGIVTYTVMMLGVTQPLPYLFSVVVETTLGMTETTGTFYYRDDPEMVVSPDEEPGCGEEDRALDQCAELAATSR